MLERARRAGGAERGGGRPTGSSSSRRTSSACAARRRRRTGSRSSPSTRSCCWRRGPTSGRPPGPRRPPRAGRPGGRRHLAAGCRGPRPLRRAGHPRVAAPRPGDRRDRDQGRLRPVRRRDRHGRPDRDLRGGRPGRAAAPLGPPRPAAAAGRVRARRVRRGGRPASSSCSPGSYDLEPLGPGCERAIVIAERP